MQIHQYQVTEPTNDHTIRDPISGQKKLYAPDPDPSLPAHKIKPATDPFSQPSQPIQSHLHSNTYTTYVPYQSSTPTMPIASALVQQSEPQASYIHLANSVAQQQLPDSYALPLTNQPQLQQHFMQQQQTLFQGMPLSVYNPTYLVTQSNHLFNEHNKQRLFKPAPNFYDTQTNLLGSGSEMRSVASAGQMYAATQDAIQGIQNELSVQSLGSDGNGDLVPSYSPLIGSRHLSANEQPLLTQQDLANLLNYGQVDSTNSIDQQPQQSFVASTYYQTGPQTAQEAVAVVVEPENDSNLLEDIATTHQRHNDAIIAQANEELEKQLQTQSAAHFGNSVDVNEHLDAAFDDTFGQTVKSPFRILVADDDYDVQNVSISLLVTVWPLYIYILYFIWQIDGFLKKSDGEDSVVQTDGILKRSDAEDNVEVRERSKRRKSRVQTTTASSRTEQEQSEAAEIIRTTESVAFGRRRTPARNNDTKDRSEKKGTQS